MQLCLTCFDLPNSAMYFSSSARFVITACNALQSRWCIHQSLLICLQKKSCRSSECLWGSCLVFLKAWLRFILAATCVMKPLNPSCITVCRRFCVTYFTGDNNSCKQQLIKMFCVSSFRHSNVAHHVGVFNEVKHTTGAEARHQLPECCLTGLRKSTERLKKLSTQYATTFQAAALQHEFRQLPYLLRQLIDCHFQCI